ncbi:hypothetical protein [Vogesella indigofera]|uniref:hypothetical protein n=1 Tax=Vogesella indigofera TaxID=45465 RepID=UPI003F4340C5
MTADLNGDAVATRLVAGVCYHAACGQRCGLLHPHQVGPHLVEGDVLAEETFHGVAPCRSVDDWIMDSGYAFVKLIVIFDVLAFCYFHGMHGMPHASGAHCAVLVHMPCRGDSFYSGKVVNWQRRRRFLLARQLLNTRRG